MMMQMKIHDRTIELLEKLDSFEWFGNVGVRDTTKAIVVNSWEEAIASAATLDWENTQLDASNNFTCSLVAVFRPLLDNFWNEYVDMIKPLSVPLVDRKISQETADRELLTQCAEWDVLHACMETQYLDHVPPGFYSKHIEWYLGGHFPCGWSGEFPEGKPIIF